MNLSRVPPFFNWSFLVIIIFSLCFIPGTMVSAGCYKSIINFGDSLSDTGSVEVNHTTECHSLPYGKSFIHGPTGRCSNGRLIIDFFAQALGLSFIPPYVGHPHQDFTHGANFAVIGATVLDSKFYLDRGVPVDTNYSLGVQFRCFQQLLPSLCNSKSNCRNFFQNVLIFVGEIGGNDYSHPLFAMNSIEEIETSVPKVIAKISSAISALINEGAVTLVVPGNFPIGCHPAFLTKYQSQDNEYDDFGCLKRLNGFSQFHNHLLQDELNRLRERYPHAKIMYADYYNAAIDLYRSPNQLGFTGGVLKACCGSGGQYNYNLSAHCGTPQSTVCDDASLYVNWDGLHYTEAGYKWIATGLLQRSLIIPPIDISCKSSY